MVDNLLRTYPSLNVDKVNEFLDSIISNVIKAYDDLRDNKPEGIDVAKLQLWRVVWMKEKEKSRRENDIDSRYQFSKKMRIHQVAHVEATSSNHPLARDDALLKTEFNLQYSFTIGIPKQAITILEKVGSGAYGIVSKCQVNSFLLASIPWCCKEFKGGMKS